MCDDVVAERVDLPNLDSRSSSKLVEGVMSS